MNKNRIIGIVLALVSVLFLVMTSQLPSSRYSGMVGPKVFPYIAAGGLLLCAIALFFKKETENEKAKGPFLDKAGWIRVLKLVILLALFPVMFKYLGFIISAVILLFIMISLFDLGKKESIWKKILVTVSVTGILYVVFIYVINIKLPTGDLIKMVLN